MTNKKKKPFISKKNIQKPLILAFHKILEEKSKLYDQNAVKRKMH